jgi:hypothetical protein
VGRFRYLECSAFGDRGEPAGDILAWQEIVFPYAPSLVGRSNLKHVRVQRDPEVESHIIEEVYRCDAGGVVEVTIADHTTECTKTFRVRDAASTVEPSAEGRKGKSPNA